VSVANGAGLPTRALITDMNQVLGHSCGNALEVWEALEFLSGTRRDPRLLDVTVALGAELLALGHLATDIDDGQARMLRVLEDGSALERFARMVAALGGPADFVERPGHYLVPAPASCPVPAPRDGWISHVATRDIGLLVIELGGGRHQATDRVDHRVGFSDMRAIGTPVRAGDPLAVVHAADAAAAQHAAVQLARCISVSDAPADVGMPLTQRVAMG
jgi:thymidine phosphorylase